MILERKDVMKITLTQPAVCLTSSEGLSLEDHSNNKVTCSPVGWSIEVPSSTNPYLFYKIQQEVPHLFVRCSCPSYYTLNISSTTHIDCKHITKLKKDIGKKFVALMVEGEGYQSRPDLKKILQCINADLHHELTIKGKKNGC
jgi:hypothetical protein